MPTQSSGPISLADVRNFYGKSGQVSLATMYRGGSMVPDITKNAHCPKSGAISLEDGYNLWKITTNSKQTHNSITNSFSETVKWITSWNTTHNTKKLSTRQTSRTTYSSFSTGCGSSQQISKTTYWLTEIVTSWNVVRNTTRITSRTSSYSTTYSRVRSTSKWLTWDTLWYSNVSKTKQTWSFTSRQTNIYTRWYGSCGSSGGRYTYWTTDWTSKWNTSWYSAVAMIKSTSGYKNANTFWFSNYTTSWQSII